VNFEGIEQTLRLRLVSKPADKKKLIMGSALTDTVLEPGGAGLPARVYAALYSVCTLYTQVLQL
jgi:hypothetical protein